MRERKEEREDRRKQGRVEGRQGGRRGREERKGEGGKKSLPQSARVRIQVLPFNCFRANEMGLGGQDNIGVQGRASLV